MAYKWFGQIVVVAIYLAIFSTLYFLLNEGFEGGSAASSNMEDVCKANQTCSTCLNTAQCGWCPDSNACIPRSGTYRLIPNWLMSLTSWLPSQQSGCKSSTFVYDKMQCGDIICNTFTDCKSCAAAVKCGWASGISKCMSKEDFAALSSGGSGSSGSGSSGSGSSGSGSSPGPLITQSTSCPAKQCTDISDCVECTNTTGCGFCSDPAKCVQLDKYGSADPTQCLQKSVLTTPYTCPCSTLTKCADCAARSGCGFCGTTKTCVNLDRNGVANPTECKADSVADSVAQCSPDSGIRGGPLGTVINGGGSGAVTDSNYNLAVGGDMNIQNNNVSATDSGTTPVSPQKKYTGVSAPGVWRPLSGGNPPGADSTGINASPLENYVKMLVTSELAAQGIPTNEPFSDSEIVESVPFQVNETSAIKNAAEYSHKAFKKIFG
jgi:Plexin repeat